MLIITILLFVISLSVLVKSYQWCNPCSRCRNSDTPFYIWSKSNIYHWGSNDYSSSPSYIFYEDRSCAFKKRRGCSHSFLHSLSYHRTHFGKNNL